MLTKEERTAITERANECVAVCGSLYEVLLGHRSAGNTTYEEDVNKLLARIIDLCDTSNMIELPVDKDGEVIRVGDTVYIGDGIKYEVAGYMMRGNSTEVILAAGAEPVYTKEPANKLTHKRPVTIASLSEQIRRVIDKGQMTAWSMAQLFGIVEQLEKSGDSDDD